MKPIQAISIPSFLLALGIGFTGCATTGPGEYSNASQGTLAGSLLGAGLGAIIGHQSGETGEGAAIGAAAGALGGYLLGNEKDKAQLQAQNSYALQAANTVVINVKNGNGSVTPVTLNRQGNVYVGPRGENYITLPTEEQLRSVYGF